MNSFFRFQIVVVFYVAIVLLLIGTNLRAGRAGRSARFKKHVVEYSEGTGKAENRLVPQPSASGISTAAVANQEYEDEIAEV